MSAAILRSAACISDVKTWPACVAGVSNNTQAKPVLLFIGKRPKQYMYHWRGLPQGSFYRDKHVSRQIFVNTSFVATKLCKYHFCRDKGFATTNIIFLSRRKFNRNKHTFVATKDVFCHEKQTACASRNIIAFIRHWSEHGT